MIRKSGLATCLSTLAISCAPSAVKDETSALDENRDVSFYVMVKSANYAQGPDDSLSFLNNHMFSEIFIDPENNLKNVTLTHNNNVIPYVKRDHDYMWLTAAS